MYASTTDMSDLHGAEFLLLVAQRGDEAALSDAMTANAIANALVQASSEADSYLATRYPVPVAAPQVPGVLRNHCINMAVYHLASTHDRLTDIIAERYKNAVAWLKDIAKGNANLVLAVTGENGGDGGTGSGGGSTHQAAPDLVIVEANEPLFKRGGW